MCSNGGKPERHHAKWNKPGRQRQILHDFTLESKIVKFIEAKSSIVISRA